MSKKGFIKLYRQIEENEFYFCEPFSKMMAWVDLILLANHKDNTIFVRGNEVNIKRGQVAWSKDNLATRWKWSKHKVYSFIDILERRGMILYKKGHQNNKVLGLITVNNYDRYQSKEPQTAQQTAQQKDDRLHTKKNVKNEKNEKKEISKPKVLQNINPLIELFKTVNLTYENIFKNKTERGVLERFVKKYGYEKTENLIKWAIDNPDQYYCITKPTELERNINKLIIKNKGKTNNYIKI